MCKEDLRKLSRSTFDHALFSNSPSKPIVGRPYPGDLGGLNHRRV